MRRGFTRVVHGVWSDSANPTPRYVLDALILLHPGAVVAGWTAARIHGLQYTAGHPPEIWLPRYRRSTDAVVRTGHLPDDDVVTISTRRVTSGVRTTVDLARHVQGDRAIAALDQCFRKDEYGRSATTPDEVRRYLDTHPNLHRARRIRAVLAESDDGSDSPWETYTRLAVHRSGLREFGTQVPVIGAKYRVDLGSEQYRVAVEFDGEHHRTKGQQELDARRYNAIHSAGWRIVKVTASTLISDRATLLNQIAIELREHGWAGPAPSTPQLDI